MDPVLLYCAECGQVRAFETPPCADGHGDDCPERACVECGFGVFLGVIPSTIAAAAGAAAGADHRELHTRRVA